MTKRQPLVIVPAITSILKVQRMREAERFAKMCEQAMALDFLAALLDPQEDTPAPQGMAHRPQGQDYYGNPIVTPVTPAQPTPRPQQRPAKALPSSPICLAARRRTSRFR